MAKFASIAVTGNAIHAAAEKSVQDARKRAIKAAQRRTGGGGVLGMQATSDSDAEDGFLDAAQLRVADALKKRLDKDLELQAVSDSGTTSSSETSGSSVDGGNENDSDSDGGGVSLFKNAPRVKKAIDRGSSLNNPLFKRPVSRGADISSDEEERIARCVAAAVDGQDLVRAAEKTAEKARINIIAVDPGSEDEGGKAKQRKRKREKAERAAKARTVVTAIATAAVLEGKPIAARPIEKPRNEKIDKKKDIKDILDKKRKKNK